MSTVIVTVRDGKASSRDLELPADFPIRALAPWLAKAIEHPDLPSEPEEVKFVLKLEGEKQALDPERTLRSAGVVHGDVLQLLIKPLPKGLAKSEAGRRFAGPGFVSAAGSVFPLRSGTILVGRVDTASGVGGSILGMDLTGLDTEESPSVSRRHAQVLHRMGGYHLHDLKSTNGTRVNGEDLNPGERVVLSDGDVVQFGDVELVFVWDSQESSDLTT